MKYNYFKQQKSKTKRKRLQVGQLYQYLFLQTQLINRTLFVTNITIFVEHKI